MRILIIGGTAFTGPHLVRRLHAGGHEVTVFHRGRTPGDLPAGIRHIHCPEGTFGDRSYFQAYADELRAVAPDVVVDMICVTEADARTVVELFRGVARRLIVISSQDVYRAYGRLLGKEPGDPDPIPLAEDAPLREKLYPYRTDPPRPPEDPARWMDDYDKILVERTALSCQEMPGTVLRYPMVYGPGDRQHRMHEYLQRMIDSRPAIVVEEGLAAWRWTRAYVEHVAHATFLAVTRDEAAGRTYNVGEVEALSTAGWIAAIAKEVSWPGRLVTLPGERLPESMRHGMDVRNHLVADTTRIRAELGYTEPVPLREAIAATVAWEREHPPKGAPIDYADEDRVLRDLHNDGTA